MSDLLKDMSQNLSEEAKELLVQKESQQEDFSEGVLAKLITTIQNIDMSFNLVAVELKQLKAKMAALEHNVDYLLSKDPQFMEALKKAQEEAKKQE
jgi:hypothetical protein